MSLEGERLKKLKTKEYKFFNIILLSVVIVKVSVKRLSVLYFDIYVEQSFYVLPLSIAI